MVLPLKRWKSRTSPGIVAGGQQGNPFTSQRAFPILGLALFSVLACAFPLVFAGGHGHTGRFTFIAGWSSPVARQAHNLKVVGSNPTPATNSP